MVTVNLIISPHIDDEILSCGGILDYFRKKGEKCHVLYCGIDERDAGPSRPSKDSRLNELKSVAKFLDFTWDLNEKNIVNNYVERDLIKQFEDIINKIKPDKVFIPFPSYNQDHRAVYNAALIALRPHDRNHFVKKVLVYEQDHVMIWEQKKVTASYFVPIDVERKIAAYKLHASQVRGMRSADLIKAIAVMRGSSINVPYAEAFEVYRWVD